MFMMHRPRNQDEREEDVAGFVHVARAAPRFTSTPSAAAPNTAVHHSAIMRMAMGPLVVYICDDLSCDTATKGKLLSAFSLGTGATGATLPVCTCACFGAALGR